jgi:Tol biopolymer transport system component
VICAPRWGRVVPIVVTLVAAACTSSSPPAAAATPGSTQGHIAFASDRAGHRNIDVMNADGTGLRQLTNDAAKDVGPVWSPDGTKIAFNSDRDGNFEIYVMNADGTGVKRLTDNPTDDGLPAWSPAGGA